MRVESGDGGSRPDFTTSPASFYAPRVATPKYDYLAMERDYVSRSPEPSVRQVALDNGVPASSLSAAQYHARTNDWHGKWLARHTRTNEIVEERLATAQAQNALREIDVRNDAVELMAEAIASARAGLKETHWVKEHNADGAELWVERPKHPATIPQVDSLLGLLQVIFGGQAPSGGEQADGGATLSAGIAALLTGGGIEGLVGFAQLARQQAGEPQPRRVGTGTGRDAAAAGED